MIAKAPAAVCVACAVPAACVATEAMPNADRDAVAFPDADKRMEGCPAAAFLLDTCPAPIALMLALPTAGRVDVDAPEAFGVTDTEPADGFVPACLALPDAVGATLGEPVA